MTGSKHTLLRSPYTSQLYNKTGEVDRPCVATVITVNPAATGKKPAAVILYIEPFNSMLWNKNEN